MTTKRKSPAFSFYPDSWFLGTSNMTAAQEGIYIRLLCLQWSSGSFSVEQAFNNSKRSASNEDIQHVLDSKFKLVNGLYFNERLENERSAQQARSENARNAGKISGKARDKTPLKEPTNERLGNGTPNGTTNGKRTEHPTEQPTENEHSDSVSDSVSVSVLDSNSDSHTPLPPKGGTVCAGVVAEDLQIPDSLDTPEFRKAWKAWIEFHKSAGKPLNPISAQFQLEQLQRQGVDKAVKDLILTMSSAREPGKIWDSDRDMTGKPKQKRRPIFEDET